MLVRIHATSVNDWDWSIVRGKPFYIRLLCGLLKPKVAILGCEIAGRVEAIGTGVDTFQRGDSVYGDISESGFGGFAEYVCVKQEALVRKPDSMSFEQATAMPHAATLALQGLKDVGQLKANQSLLINGAGGGVGFLGIQIARVMGAKHVAGVDHAKKLDAMQTLGFDERIDYTQEDFTQSGKRYDLILDTKTNRSPFRYLKALKPKGVYVTVGGTATRLLQSFLLGPIIALFSKRRTKIVALKTNQDLDRINDLFESGKLRPIIDGPYPFSELPAAVQRFGEAHHHGKVVISCNSLLRSEMMEDKDENGRGR